MAGDWIKLRKDLNTDPAVIHIAAALNLDVYGVVGRLAAVWAWADTHSTDGTIPGVAWAWIDHITASPGFAEAMTSVGWLGNDRSSISFPNFSRHMGRGAKARMSGATRQKAFRERRQTGNGAVTVVSPSRNGRVTVPAATLRYVMLRDAETCAYCGQVGAAREIQSGFMNTITPDHLTPVTNGGDNAPANLVACCSKCNNTKNNRTPEQWGILPKFLQPGITYSAGHITDSRNGTVTVTVTEKCDATVTREEKRIEEDNTPPPPAKPGGVASVSEKPPRVKKVRAMAEAIPIPLALDTPAFNAVWADWLAARREKGNPVTARAAEMQFKTLAAVGVARAVGCVEASIANDWTGIFPDRKSGKTESSATTEVFKPPVIF